MLASFFEQSIWQKRNFCSYLLSPLSLIFRAISNIRKAWLKKQAYTSTLPVVVIGNISVGGNGKTPVLIAIAKYLTSHGLSVAIISRGYKAQTFSYPHWVAAESSAQCCGDEPVMIVQQTKLPVIIDPNRVRAIKSIESKGGFDVILSDDGLQHYKMQRQLEIAVVGSQQALGNQLLLPAGPLREPITRLSSVDWVLGDKGLPFVSHQLSLQVLGIFDLLNDIEVNAEHFKDKKVYTITGIAWPERFYQTVKNLGIEFTPRSFDDHHDFCLEDFSPFRDAYILMTEKDAVKCRNIPLKNAYVLKIEQVPPPAFLNELLLKLK